MAATRKHEDPEIEQALLGGLMMYPEAFGVVGALQPCHFADLACRIAAGVLLDSLARGVELDMVSLDAELRRVGRLDHVGGSAWVSQLTDHCTSHGAIRGYAERVREMHARRQFRLRLTQVVRSLDAGDPLPAVGGDTMDAVAGLTDASHVETCSIPEAIQALEDIQTGKTPGFLDCGFDSLNRIAPRRGQLCVIGALSSVGKTALSLEVGGRIAARGERVLAISLEMSAEELQFRRLSSKARVDGEEMVRGRLNADAWARLGNSVEELHAQKFKPVSGAFDVSGVSALIRAEHAREPLVAVFVDYLGMLRLEGKERHDLELGRAAMDLKNLAKDLRFALFILAQLNRKSQDQRGKGDSDTPREPRNGDLRDSGQIEHCADVIWLLHREGRWIGGMGDEQDLTVICSKRRGARMGRETLRYHLPSQSMHDPDPVAKERGFEYD